MVRYTVQSDNYIAQQNPVFVSIIYIYHPWFEVNSGVRQGDSLSPTLLILFINDLITELITCIDFNGRNICSLLL